MAKHKTVTHLPAPPPAEKPNMATLLGSWIEVGLRPPPGWVCWNVERITAGDTPDRKSGRGTLRKLRKLRKLRIISKYQCVA